MTRDTTALVEVLDAVTASVHPSPDLLVRIRELIRARTAAPVAPGTAGQTTADCEGVDMSTVPKRPMQLEVGDIIAVVPATGENCHRRVEQPPVRFEEDVELEYRENGHADRMVVHRHTPVLVDLTHRERRLHAMNHGEEHMALRWLHDHEPVAFDRAADYVDQVRALGDSAVRKEGRS